MSDLLAKKLRKKPETINAELLETAFRLATGYHVIEEEAIKVKTFEDIGGKIQPVERVETVPIKRYIAPNTSVNMFLIKSRIPEYGDNPVLDTIIEVEMKAETEKYAK